MKRPIISKIILVLIVMLLVANVSLVIAEVYNVSVSNQKFRVNGKDTNLSALNINGNNYVKVSDIAEALDIDVAYDSHNNIVSFEKSSPYSGVRTVSGTNDKDNKKQTIEIDIKSLGVQEYIYFDICEIKGDDTIVFDINSDGKSSIYVGFMKEKNINGTTYYGNGDLFNKKGKISSTFKVNGFEGKYYFYIKNSGKEVVKDIKGTVNIVRGN